jgi:class 3 adenylate cyclase
MPNLPSGTVTFLFSDIEGSTAHLKRLGDDGYPALLAIHRRLVRETFALHDGQEIDTQGDAFFYSFPRARGAVAAAVAVQRAHEREPWPDGVTVRIRLGLHTGEPVVGEEGYTGLDVVRAARISAVARGGQVLLSETTRAIVAGDLPEGIEMRALGEQRLKDIDRPEALYELRIPDVHVTEAAAVPASPPTDVAPAAGVVPVPESVLTGLESYLPADTPGWVRGLTRQAATLGDRTRQSIEERALAELASDPELAAALPGGLSSLFQQRAGKQTRSSIPPLPPGLSQGSPADSRRRDRPNDRRDRGRLDDGQRGRGSPPPTQRSMAEEIAELQKLRTSGALTPEQYARAVDKLIEGG